MSSSSEASCPRPAEGTRAGLAERFTRRMAPVVALVSLLVAFGPPLLYGAFSWQSLQAQASAHAEQVARPMAIVAARQPHLWRYNAIKVVEATSGQRDLQDLGSVQIADCAGAPIFSGRELGLGSGKGGGPTGWAPVVVAGAAVAWVQVSMDGMPLARRTLAIGLGSVAFGGLLVVVLFLFPARVVRGQAAEIERALADVADAEARLVIANADLQRRVEVAVQEVRALSGRVVSIQETERRRIAMELHDGVGQLVTGLRMELDLADAEARARPSGGVEPEAGSASRRQRAIELCDTIVAEVRNIVRDLRPLELEDAGLEEALRGTTERFEVRSSVVTTFRVEGGPVPEGEIAVCLLRVVQEALNNIGRHAGASEAVVRLNVTPEAVTLSIEDDGVGFEPSGEGAGMGLRNMRERVAFFGGELSVVSAPGQGVRLLASIPEHRGRG